MADATGAVTSNYSFKTIAGTDVAGYTSINSVIASIDTQLRARNVGMILLMRSSDTTPTGWKDYTTANGYTSPTPPTPPTGHKYIIGY
jgi:hypothetical protein